MKKRKLEKLTNCPGVFRVLIWSDELNKWMPPERGLPFRAFVKIKEGGQREGKYFATLAQAKAHYLRSQKQVSAPQELQLPTRSKNGMVFGELVKAWQDSWLPNKNESTQIRYRSYLKHFEYFWNLPIEQITPTQIDQWITLIKQPEYVARGHSTRRDYRHEFSVLHGILGFYASRFNRNYQMPFLKEHKSMIKVREKVTVNKDLNVNEFQAFMTALKQVCTEYDCEVVYYLAAMQYATYCRVQEAAALHHEDFDFVKNQITINKKVQWLRARGYETKIVDGAKANGGKVLPMGEFAARTFREWVMKSGVRQGLLFCDEGNILTYRQIEYRYTQALRRANLPFRATHLLRHAALTEFYDTSKDLLLTARMAGQRDIRSTMKYTKVRDEKALENQKQVDQRQSVLIL